MSSEVVLSACALLLLAGFLLTSSYVVRDAFGPDRLPQNVRTVIGGQHGGPFSVGLGAFLLEVLVAACWCTYLLTHIRSHPSGDN